MNSGKQAEIQEFINPSVYHNQPSLPYCQWDLRDLFNPMEREKAKKAGNAAKLWEELTKFAKSKGLDSTSLGLVVVEEQAKLARFKPSDSWFNGEYVFGKETKNIYCNPFPILSIIKKYDKVYREKIIGADGIPYMGNRYYPTKQEEANIAELKNKYFIYQRYLVALLEYTGEEYQLLHEVPFLFSPKKVTGIQFAQKYNQMITTITGYYGINVAPFVFANHFSPISEIYRAAKNENLLSQVVTLKFEEIQNQEHMNSRFIGKKLGKQLEQWYAQYSPAPPEADATLQVSPYYEEEFSEDVSF